MGKYESSGSGKERSNRQRGFFWRNWKRFLFGLSCAVVAGTIGALTLPAITMSKTACPLEEHTHTADCYGEVPRLRCTLESLGVHSHTQDCFHEEELICGQADFILHEHDGLCYDENGVLICQLPEIKAHTHDETCYAPGPDRVVDEGHTHSEACYGQTPGESITCGQTEGENHTHTEDCCGNGQAALICGQTERPRVTEPGAPVLTCEEPEYAPHTHEDDAPDTDCPLPELRSHQHGEACFVTERVLICPLEEHTHSDVCAAKADTLTEEEKRQAEDVAFLIGALPPVEEIEGELTRLAGDESALAAYREKLTASLRSVFDEYNALSDAQRAAVENAEKLGQYGFLLGNEIELPAGGQTYSASAGTVSASVKALGADLPEGAVFQVAPVAETSEDYADAMEKINAYLARNGQSANGITLLDMHFADQEGTELPFAGEAQVTLRFQEPIFPGAASVRVLHVTEDGAEDVLTECALDDKGVSGVTLTTGGFSSFAIVAQGEMGGVEERLSGDNAYIYEAQMKMDGYRQAIATGTADWDDDNAPGNDSSAENDILRTFDVATYTASFKTGLRPSVIAQGISGYRTGTVYFEFIMNESAERAQFEPGSMGWLATYEEAKYEMVAEENRQILRGSFLMTPSAGNDSTIGNSYSELTVAVRALRMKQGETLQPTFTIWLEGNDVNADVVDGIPTKVVTGNGHSCAVHGEQEFCTIIPDEITISAAYSLNLAIEKANASTTSYSDWFDFNTGNTSGDHEALDYGSGRLRGRMNCYGLTLQLVGKSKTNGLKGVMVPEAGSTISFDLTLSSTYKPDGKADVNLDKTAYAPLVWSAGPNLRGVAAQDGREMTIASDNAGAAAPYNNAGGGTPNQCVKDGGTWYFTQDGWNPRIIHVTVENFVIDLSSLSNFPVNKSGNSKLGEDSDYYNPQNESIKNAWDIQLACFSGGEFWVVSPLEAKADGTNYKNIEATYGNGSLNFDIQDSGFMLGNEFVDQAITTDDQMTDGVGLTNPGFYQTDIYYTKYGQGWEKPLTEDCFDNGLDWATPGQKISIFHLLSCDKGEGNARGAAMELFAKFDDAFFEPDGTYNVNFFCPMTGNFQYGKPTYKVSWVARGDGYGWNHHGLKPDQGAGTGDYTDYDWNMIQAWPDQIYYYDTLDALKAAGKVCIGAFLEVRGITGPGMNHIEFTINGQVKENCKPKYVYMTTPYAAIYTVGDLNNAARTYWNNNGGNYTFGNSDASFRWVADADEKIDSFVKNGMKWRSQERELQKYMKTGYTTVYNGNTYGAATPTFERRVGTSTGDSKSKELSTMKKTSYNNGVTTGTHDRFLLDSCLVTSHVTAIRKTTAQTAAKDGAANTKKTYSLDMGQRTVDFSLTPSVTRTLGSGPAGPDSVTHTDITIVDTLPAEFSYIPGTSYWGGTYTQDPTCMNPGTVTGGTKLEPQVKSISGGRTELCWVLENVELNQLDTMELAPIHYSCELVGTLEDQQGISNHAEIWSTQDNQRERKTGNNNLAIYGITIQRSSAVSMVKLADQSRVELDSDMGFTMTVGNNGNTDCDGCIIVDDLPWNGDGRGTSFSGTMSVKDFKVTESLLKKPDGGEQIMFFYTTNPDYRGKTSEDYGENYNQFQDNPTDWTYLTFNNQPDEKGLVTATNLPANAVQIVGVGSIPAGKVLRMHVTLSLTGDKAGDKVVNQLTLDTLNSKATTTVVGRSLSGLTWIDSNHDGLQNNGEQTISGVKVTLKKKDADGKFQPLRSIETGQKLDVRNDQTVPETYEQGRYLFEGLGPGTYAVEFTSGKETDISYYHASPDNVETDDTIDSDGFPHYREDGTLAYTVISHIEMPPLEEIQGSHYQSENHDSGFYSWGTVLPETGGAGTRPYTSGGLALICVLALAYSKPRKRRKGAR